MQNHHILRMKAGIQDLEALRAFVQRAAEDLGAPSPVIADAVLATDEAAANIILHGYQGFPGPLEVEVELKSGALIIRLRDEAAPFDPTQVPDPDMSLPLEHRPIGKMGVFLMNQSVDQIHHRMLPDGGNELTLIKILPASRVN